MSSARARFGPFLLDAERRQLFREDQPVHLTPKAYRLLSRLADASPRAVSKDELQQTLWPSTFVDEANLSVLVAELRAALGDDARHPRYIRTVHGFGYAFAVDVLREPDPAASPDRTAWWLVFEHDQVRLEAGASIVGREASAGIRVDNASVSRRHARLRLEEAGISLEDLGSKNGTWVNGVRAGAPVALRDGDEVRFGSVTATVRQLTVAGSTETLGPL